MTLNILRPKIACLRHICDIGSEACARTSLSQRVEILSPVVEHYAAGIAIFERGQNSDRE